jgi:hypothetical protein
MILTSVAHRYSDDEVFPPHDSQATLPDRLFLDASPDSLSSDSSMSSLQAPNESIRPAFDSIYTYTQNEAFTVGLHQNTGKSCCPLLGPI